MRLFHKKPCWADLDEETSDEHQLSENREAVLKADLEKEAPDELQLSESRKAAPKENSRINIEVPYVKHNPQDKRGESK